MLHKTLIKLLFISILIPSVTACKEHQKRAKNLRTMTSGVCYQHIKTGAIGYAERPITFRDWRYVLVMKDTGEVKFFNRGTMKKCIKKHHNASRKVQDYDMYID